jgi:hypothetical protein
MTDKWRLAVEQKAKVVLIPPRNKRCYFSMETFHAYFGSRWAPIKQYGDFPDSLKGRV